MGRIEPHDQSRSDAISGCDLSGPGRGSSRGRRARMANRPRTGPHARPVGAWRGGVMRLDECGGRDRHPGVRPELATKPSPRQRAQ